MQSSFESQSAGGPVRRDFLKVGVASLVAAGVGAMTTTPARAEEDRVKKAGPGKSLPKKSREEWREALSEVPVFDTHSHLNKPGVPIGARDIWDILDYLWFQRELNSVGYPKNAGENSEDGRINHFVQAFQLARNTIWSMVVRRSLLDLYGVDLVDAESVRRADNAIREKAADPAWPRHVLGVEKIVRVTTNIEQDVGFPGLPGVGVAVPILPNEGERVDRILAASDPLFAAREEAARIQSDVAGVYGRGWRGMRVGTGAFQDGSPGEILEVLLNGCELKNQEFGRRQVSAFVTHTVLGALSDHGMFAQLFLGIDRLPGCSISMAVSDPRRITNLYPLFERYSCGFELVSGAPGNNMDVVQAARIYPHVCAGGLWWYNFRNSTYNESMQMRIEALPAPKSVILASDARCVEWCHAKTLLVKWLLADFLHAQVRNGWINESDAMWVAREWLHDAAARRYV